MYRNTERNIYYQYLGDKKNFKIYDLNFQVTTIFK